MPCRVGVRFKEDDYEVLSTGSPIVAVVEMVVTIATRLPRWHSGKESTCQCRGHKREGSVARSKISPGEGNGNPLR